MKRILSIIFISILVLTGCGKPASNKDIIAGHYNTIMKTNDTSVVRSELSELQNLANDSSLTEQDRMFAKYSYNVAYGIARLSLSGESISAFDFPEIEILSETVDEVKKGNLSINETMVSESSKFVQNVEKFLK